MTAGASPVTHRPPGLTVRCLTKCYPGVSTAAVCEVDLTVAAAEVVAVVGESGCGKTTLLRLIAGLEIPDAGAIRIGDRLVAGSGTWVPPERRGIGMVFQEFALFPHLRVMDNVAFGLRSLPRRERRERAGHVLEMVGLGAFAGRYPHQLSGGQQQRVALARALAPEPRMLLLDEPFSNLDAPLKAALREELAVLLRRTGIPALLVVHDADDVLALGDRVAVMRGGRILQNGAPDALYLDPADEYVARFFGDTNVLPARPAAGGLETPLGFLPSSGLRCSAGAGDEARILLRPEDLVVSTEPGGGSPAVVRRVQRNGFQQRIVLTLEAGGVAKVILTAITGPDLDVRPGDRVHVRARAGRLYTTRPE